MKGSTSQRMWFLAAITALLMLSAAPPADNSTGTLKGRVTIPQRKIPSAKDYGAKPSIKVEKPDAPIGVVWVGSGAPPVDTKNTPPFRIEQRGYQFRPDVAVVQTGTPVVFPNEDQMYHSVFSLSEAKRFDLGRYRKGEEPDAVVFGKAGIVQLSCEVHEHMRAYLLVVDTPWHAVTTPDGAFTITGIPPGKHMVKVWLGAKKEFEKSIEISAGQSLEVDWKDESGTSSQ